jgi:hypothetical protein
MRILSFQTSILNRRFMIYVGFGPCIAYTDPVPDKDLPDLDPVLGLLDPDPVHANCQLIRLNKPAARSRYRTHYCQIRIRPMYFQIRIRCMLYSTIAIWIRSLPYAQDPDPILATVFPDLDPDPVQSRCMLQYCQLARFMCLQYRTAQV